MKNNTCKTCKYAQKMIAIGMGFRCTKPENVHAIWNKKKYNPALIPNFSFSCDFYQQKNNHAKTLEIKSSNIIMEVDKWEKYIKIDLAKWYHTYDNFSKKVKELHLLLFPEEYFSYELNESKDNILSKEYLAKINIKRKELGVSLITANGISPDTSSINYCESIIEKQHNFITYDFIADVHGRCTLLKEKLIKLGYFEKDGIFISNNRKAIFLGDLVDRGSEVGETLQLVKKMCDYGSAEAILGNHDWNWLMYNTLDSEGNFLRKHNEKNDHQNEATRQAWKTIHFTERKEILNWLGNLPFVLETKEYRVVHACWDIQVINKLKQSIFPNPLTFNNVKNNLINNTEKQAKQIRKYVEVLLSGIEYKLPEGITFKDVDGNIRSAVRIKWWCLDKENSLKNLALNSKLVENIDINITTNYQFDKEIKTTFFGHYHNEQIAFNKEKKLYTLDIKGDIGICSVSNFNNQNTYNFKTKITEK